MYETICLTCQKKKENEMKSKGIWAAQIVQVESEKEEKILKRKKEKEKNGNKEKEEEERREFFVKYVGEKGRSCYEHASEPKSDFINLDDKSHLLKHFILEHQHEMKIHDMECGVRVRGSYKTALERQIGEAVAINVEKKAGKILMNSKGEYN